MISCRATRPEHHQQQLHSLLQIDGQRGHPSICINCIASWTGWADGPLDSFLHIDRQPGHPTRASSASAAQLLAHTRALSASAAQLLCTHPSVVSISCAAFCTLIGEHHQHQLRSFLHIDGQRSHPTRASSASAAQLLAHDQQPPDSGRSIISISYVAS